MAKYGVWVQDPDYVPPSILILSEIGRGIGLFAAFPKLDLTPFGPVWEGQDGLVVPPLSVLVDGTHRTPRIGYRWMGHLYRPYYIRATSGTRAS